MEIWNDLSKARNEGRLFQKLKWPTDVELVCVFHASFFSMFMHLFGFISIFTVACLHQPTSYL